MDSSAGGVTDEAEQSYAPRTHLQVTLDELMERKSVTPQIKLVPRTM